MPKRVVTLALHPSIDRVVRLRRLKPGATADAELLMSVPAGKGTNTARALSCVWPKPERIVSAGWIGETEKDWYTARLEELNGIRAALCPRACSTRLAYTLLEASGRETHLKERMPPPTRAEEASFLKFWRELLRPGDLVAFCGSAPAGASARLLREIFAAAREKGVEACIADSSGAALAIAGAAGLDGLKGNAVEIGAWLKLGGPFVPGKYMHRRFLEEAFRRPGAPRAVLITLGAGGAALATPDILLHAPAPALSGPQPSGSGSAAEPADRQGRDARAAPQSATGCGDAATAGWLWAILQGCSPEVTLRRAVACGTAKLISADPGNLDKRRVERLLAAARIARI